MNTKALRQSLTRKGKIKTMKGTRPLNNTEIRLVSACFNGTFEHRNRGLFMLGVSTGGRISELLSLTIGDVYQNGRAVTDLLFEKSIVKGGEVSRAVPCLSTKTAERQLRILSRGTGRSTTQRRVAVRCSRLGINRVRFRCTDKPHIRC